MQAVKDTSPYRERLGALTRGADDGWLTAMRKRAFESFEARGFPTRKHEDWKYTGLSAVEKIAFAAGDPATRRRIEPETLDPFRFGGVDCCHLVFVDGFFSEALSDRSGLPGSIQVMSLAEALAAGGDLVRPHLGQHAGVESTPLVALNTALMQDGVFVHIPRGESVDTVIHLLFVSTVSSRPTDSHPRNLVVLEESARATVVEDYVGLEEGTYFTNPVTEAVLGENAELEHHKLVRESDEAYHVGYVNIDMARASRFTGHAITMGGRLVRNNVNVELAGEGIVCTLNGLVIGSAEEHIDNQTRIAHLKPHCESHELYKAVLDDRAEGVFNGKIYVARDAQKTDAKQSNHALLLTREAQMNSKPELEIYADDVKCTHGATVGQLDADALFYLRSRGVGRTDAENLLTFAFASDVVERIRIEPIRREVERMLYAKLPQAKEIKE